MSGRWYKRCGADFIRATMKLTLEEKGAYSLCLDLIYDQGGPIADDARWLSGVCGVSIRKWNAIRESLIRHGKLTVDGDYLSNARAALELVSSEFQRRNQVESGAKGGRKRVENEIKANEINGSDQATLKPLEEIREEKKEEGTPLVTREGLANVVLAIAYCVKQARKAERNAIVAEWNAMAADKGLPLVSKLNDQRTASLDARLAEHGRAAFTEAIRRVAASALCRGETSRGWKANFDFVLQPSSFLKLIEGNYDGDTQRNGPMGGAGRRNGTDLRPGSIGATVADVLARYDEADRAEAEQGRDWADVVVAPVAQFERRH